MSSPFDYSKFTDAELEQLSGNAPDFSKFSDQALQAIAGVGGEDAASQIAAGNASPAAATASPPAVADSASRLASVQRADAINQQFATGQDFADSPGALGLGGLERGTRELAARGGPRTALELAATAAAIPFTGGLSVLPRIAAMGATGFGASLLAEPLDPTPAPLRTAAATGLRTAAGEAGGSALAGAARAAIPTLARVAENQGAKALGFIGSSLRQSGTESARNVARVALDEGVLTPLAGAEAMLGRAEATQAAAGQALEGLRQQIDSLSPGQSVLPILRAAESSLRDWIPGISDEPVLVRHLSETLQDIAAHADPSTGTITAAGLAKLKKLLGDRAYANALQVPETLGGALAPRTETARGIVQGAEETAAANAGLADPFARAKEVYGAMARLTDPRTGALTARVARDLGNNQVFGLSPQLGGITGALAGGGPGGALGALAGGGITRFLHQRGNQLTATAGNRIAHLAANPATPIGLRSLAQILAYEEAR